MRLSERLPAETAAFHADADEDAVEMLGAVSPADYQRFLVRAYGFVAPVERALVSTRDIQLYLDLRRFKKQELLRRDLEALHVPADAIANLPQCTVPLFNSPEEALGWAYVVERATLGHHNLFRHLASRMPGEIAFASAFLKCYFGAVGEMWKTFLHALDMIDEGQSETVVIEASKTAFRAHRNWRHSFDARDDWSPPSAPDEQRIA